MVARGLMLVCALIVIGQGRVEGREQQGNPPEPAGQRAGKELPDAPGESKKESATPAQQIQDMTKQVVSETTDTAKTTLLRARDWESGWIAGIYVGKNRKLVPMTGQQRMDYYLRQTFTTPEAYMKRMFAAGVDQARGVPYQWDDGWAGYGERFASREGQFFTSNSLAAWGNAKLGYEVRYDKCKCSDFRHRMQHAILRNFLTYDRSEENLHPQWALYGGAFGGGLMATAWKPSPKNAWANGGWAVLGQAGYGALLNFITEFGTEINRKQGVK
ncbi:MAG: hypothetical protein WA653_23400 [Candidatus Sulfotelmatobacter sp.]